MSVTLTFLKAKNSKECDSFMGTFSGPGDSISEWDILNRDKEIKTVGIILKVLEYEDANTLSVEYRKFVNKYPCFVLKRGDDMSSLLFYPYRAPKKAKDIKIWTIGYVNKQITTTNPIATEVKEPAANSSEAITSVVQVPKSNAAYVFGMSTIVVAVAVAAGAVGGGLLADMSKGSNKTKCTDPDHNLLLVHETGQDPDYWNETPKPVNKKSVLFNAEEDLFEEAEL